MSVQLKRSVRLTKQYHRPLSSVHTQSISRPQGVTHRTWTICTISVNGIQSRSVVTGVIRQPWRDVGRWWSQIYEARCLEYREQRFPPWKNSTTTNVPIPIGPGHFHVCMWLIYSWKCLMWKVRDVEKSRILYVCMYVCVCMHSSYSLHRLSYQADIWTIQSTYDYLKMIRQRRPQNLKWR